jgi:hypothetical protein
MGFLTSKKIQWIFIYILFYILSLLCLFTQTESNMGWVPSEKLPVNKEYASKQVVIKNFYINRFEVTQKFHKKLSV